MAEADTDFAALAKRFTQLGRADRKAVLAGFSAEERRAFEQAQEAEGKRQAEEKARRRRADRQFLGYSPWLAQIVEGAIADPETSPLAAGAAEAVAAEHTSLIEACGAEPRIGWRGLLDRLSDMAAPRSGSGT